MWASWLVEGAKGTRWGGGVLDLGFPNPSFENDFVWFCHTLQTQCPSPFPFCMWLVDPAEDIWPSRPKMCSILQLHTANLGSKACGASWLRCRRRHQGYIFFPWISSVGRWSTPQCFVSYICSTDLFTCVCKLMWNLWGCFEGCISK